MAKSAPGDTDKARNMAVAVDGTHTLEEMEQLLNALAADLGPELRAMLAWPKSPMCMASSTARRGPEMICATRSRTLCKRPQNKRCLLLR